VAIGLIWRDGRLLIARRPPDAHLPNLWEFPGGKCEPGETPGECLAREAAEELAIEIGPSRLFAALEHTYPDRRVRLTVLECRWIAGEPHPIGCAECRWVSPAELSEYEFPAANAPILEKLLCAT
jgi:mutator protein MutT